MVQYLVATATLSLNDVCPPGLTLRLLSSTDIDMGFCGDGAMNNIQMVRSLQIRISRSSEEHVDRTKSIFELAGEGGEAFGI
jgi:hypothetical protein